MWFGTKVVYVCTPLQNVHQSYGGKHNPGCSVQQVSINFFFIKTDVRKALRFHIVRFRLGHLYVISTSPQKPAPPDLHSINLCPHMFL